MNLFKVINQLCNVQYHTNSNLLTSFFIMCVYIILGITILDVNNPGNWELLKKSNSRKPKLYSAKKRNN